MLDLVTPRLLQSPSALSLQLCAVAYPTTSDKTEGPPHLGLQPILEPTQPMSFFTLLPTHLRFQGSPFKNAHGDTQSALPLYTSTTSSQQTPSLLELSYLLSLCLSGSRQKLLEKAIPLGPLAAPTSDGPATMLCGSSCGWF